jgi:hypothetical protein
MLKSLRRRANIQLATTTVMHPFSSAWTSNSGAIPTALRNEQVKYDGDADAGRQLFDGNSQCREDFPQ